jgi:hypothetical protein
MDMRTVVLGALACGGCMAGGGPFVGYGGGRWHGGVEAGVGFALLQANVGVDNKDLYLRGDLVGYGEGFETNGNPPVGGRIGGGVIFHDQGAGGMFVLGGGGVARSRGSCYRSYDQYQQYHGILELQLRYVGSWTVGLAARFDASMYACGPS